MKTEIKKITSLICAFALFSALSVSACAHDLRPWARLYGAENTNGVYSFAFNSGCHMDSNQVNYCYGNSRAKSSFDSAVRYAFDSGWKGFVYGKETKAAEAHVKISFDPVLQPENSAACAAIAKRTFTNHIRINKNDAEIIFYRNSAGYSRQLKNILAVHEIGHLWGLADLYGFNSQLNSIYSDNYAFNMPTRHDRNAIRIGLENYMYEPANGGPWYYQPSPGEFYIIGDANADGRITASDARLALRSSAGLTSLNSVGRITADADGSGRVTAADARLILRFSAGLIKSFPSPYR